MMKKMFTEIAALSVLTLFISCSDTLSMTELKEKMAESAENASLDVDDKDRPVLSLVEVAKTEEALRAKSALYVQGGKSSVGDDLFSDDRYHTKSVWLHINAEDATSGVKYILIREQLLNTVDGTDVSDSSSIIENKISPFNSSKNIFETEMEYNFRYSMDGIISLSISVLDAGNNESLDSVSYVVLKDTVIPESSFKLYNKPLYSEDSAWKVKYGDYYYDSTELPEYAKNQENSFDSEKLQKKLSEQVRKVYFEIGKDEFYKNKQSGIDSYTAAVKYSYDETNLSSLDYYFDSEKNVFSFMLPEQDGTKDTFIYVYLTDLAGNEKCFRGVISKKADYLGCVKVNAYYPVEFYCNVDSVDNSCTVDFLAYTHYKESDLKSLYCNQTGKLKRLFLGNTGSAGSSLYQTINIYNKDTGNEYSLFSYPSDVQDFDLKKTAELTVPSVTVDVQPGERNSSKTVCHLNIDYSVCASNPPGTRYFYSVYEARDPDDYEAGLTSIHYYEADVLDFEMTKEDNLNDYYLDMVATYDGASKSNRISFNSPVNTIPPSVSYKNSDYSCDIKLNNNSQIQVYGVTFIGDYYEEDGVYKMDLPKDDDDNILVKVYFIPYKYENAEKYATYTYSDIAEYTNFNGLMTDGATYVSRSQWKNLTGDYYLYLYCEDTSALKNYNLFPVGVVNLNYATRVAEFNPWYAGENKNLIVWSDYDVASFTKWSESSKKWVGLNTILDSWGSGDSAANNYKIDKYNYSISWTDSNYYKNGMPENVFIRMHNYINNSNLVYGAYYFYSTKQECNLKNLVDHNSNITILCDKPCFVHTVWGDEDYGDTAYYWELYNYGEDVSPMQISSSSNYTPDLTQIPSGKYYRVIAYFADGTSAISKVRQKK